MANKLHYTFFVPLEGLGGIELQMANRALDAISRGYGALLVCREGSKIDQYAQSKKIPVAYMNIKVNYLDIGSSLRLARIMRKNKSSVCVICQSKHLSIAVMARNFFYSRMAVVFYQQTHSGIKKIDFFHNWVYSNVDGVVTLTNAMREQIAHTTITPRSKVDAIPYGIQVDKFNPENFNKQQLREKFGFPIDKFIIGYVGRIDWFKDQKTALNAFRIAQIENSVLVLAGDESQQDYSLQLKERVKDDGLEDKVIFVPFTYEVPELLNSFDVFLSTALYETFGLAIIEAMAAGLPVICGEGGGIREIIKDNENGLLFSPGDASECADRIIELNNSPAIRRNLSEKARQTAIERYDYNKQTKRFFEFCDNTYNLRFTRKR